MPKICKDGGTLLAHVNDSTTALSNAEDTREALLRSIAEELKMPLMYIARQAEFCRSEESLTTDTLRDMQANADMALRLVDSYVLGLDLATKKMNLQLEPVSISATLYDVAHDLSPILRQRNAELQLVLTGKYGEVMAHKQGLVSALYNVGSVLSEIDDATDTKQTIKIVAHRSPQGIIAGMYIDGHISSFSMESARKWLGTARQPFMDLSPHAGAGIFVADAIFASMNTRLRFGRFRGNHGLAATLQPNCQLQLI